MRSVSLRWNKLFLFLGLIRSRQSYSPTYILPELAFSNLVRREFRRSERSGHFCRVLLIYRTNTQGHGVPLSVELADKTISLLFHSCRDTDYIGWYRQGRILGVLLTTLQRDSMVDGCQKLQARLADRLRDAFTFTDARFLQIHVLDPGELTTFNPSGHSPSSPVPKD